MDDRNDGAGRVEVTRARHSVIAALERRYQKLGDLGVTRARVALMKTRASAEFQAFASGQHLDKRAELQAAWPVAMLRPERAAALGFGDALRIVLLTSKQVESHGAKRWKNYSAIEWNTVQDLLDHGEHQAQFGRNHFFWHPRANTRNDRVRVAVIHGVGEEIHLGTFNARIRFDWVLKALKRRSE